MILQRFVWKTEEQSETAELYYHTDAQVEVSEKGLKVPANAQVSFDTYFNAFLAKSWKRYTKVQSVRFRVSVNGAGKVKLMKEDGCIAEQEFSGKQEIFFWIEVLKASLYYLVLETKETTVLERGMIETEEPGREIRLALVTCTYHREEELLRNLRILKEANRETEDVETTLERIYVVDNAKSLQAEIVEDERTILIPNPNTGGAGGFTRGMQEAMKLEGMTHIVLMDDDVQIEFEAFRRTKSFLQYIKKEYEGNFIGGAMLRRDVPYLLHAAGEDWADGLIENPYARTDLRDIKNVLKISKPVVAKQPYAGWWYCCISKEHIEQKGYPMPFFLHVDDVEYSLRSGKPPIYLNGIAVWHEEFEDKRSSVIEYYDVRNRLITNAMYKKSGQLWNAIYILCERFYATVFRYRYRDFALSVKAVEDFLKGPEWLYQVDAEKLHKSLADYGYKMQRVHEQPEEKVYPEGSKLKTIGRYFLPATGRAVIRMGAPVRAYAGKKKVLLVEPKNGKGFEVEKKWGETGKCVWKLVCSLRKILFSYLKKLRLVGRIVI